MSLQHIKEIKTWKVIEQLHSRFSNYYKPLQISKSILHNYILNVETLTIINTLFKYIYT